MTEDELIRYVAGFSGVVAQTASDGDGSPQVAWGDSFFYYDPENDAGNRPMPFVTIVVKDYPGFDTASNLNRDGVFRVNIGVGRTRFEELVGYPPAEHPDHHDDYDYAELNRLLPHPAYATQGWVAILNPDGTTSELTRSLILEAHQRASKHHRPQASG